MQERRIMKRIIEHQHHIKISFGTALAVSLGIVIGLMCGFVLMLTILRVMFGLL